MKPRRTKTTDVCLELAGGNEDNYLWAERTTGEDGRPMIVTFWEPTDEERRVIAEGGKIVLFVQGRIHPPVAMSVLSPDA